MRRTLEFRARVLAMAGSLEVWTVPDEVEPDAPAAQPPAPPVETVWAPEAQLVDEEVAP